MTTTSASAAEAFRRSRAVGSAEEEAPRVRFRSTPSVRYFKSTHSASFGTSTENDDELLEDSGSAQDPRYKAMRETRIQRRLRKGVVADVAFPERTRLVRKIADDARNAMESLVRGLLLDAEQDEWKSRVCKVNAGDSRGKTEAWEKQQKDGDHVVVKKTLPCTFRELQSVLATTRWDELDAAMVACLSDKLESAAIFETVTLATSDVDETADRDALEPVQVTVKSVAMPRTKLEDSAAQMWKLMRRNDDVPKAVAEETLEVIDCVMAPIPNASSSSRILQLMASAAGTDHAVLGDTQVGYFIQRGPDHTTTVAVYTSKRKKRSTAKSFGWSTSKISDQLMTRMAAVTEILWSFVERRRLGFQIVAYPDVVYEVEDVEAAQFEVTHCPVCEAEFGFLRRRHFCHLCALWVCLKCSRDVDVETHAMGWLQSPVKVCEPCYGRVHECVYDYRRGVVVPSSPLIVSGDHDEAQSVHSSRALAKTCVELMTTASSESDREACAVVVETLVGVLSPEDVKDFISNGSLSTVKQKLNDEIGEAVGELAELMAIPVVARRDCMLSFDMTRRQYVLPFNKDTDHPQSPVGIDDPDRLRRVDKLGLLSLPSPILTLDTLCAVAASALRCSMAFVSVVHRTETFYIAKHGLSVSKLDRDDGFCAYTLQNVYPLVVLDMGRDIRSRFFTLTTDCGGRFYCGVPLLGPDESFVMATFSVVDSSPRKAMTPTDYSLFNVLATTARAVLLRTLDEKPSAAATFA